MGGFHGRKRLRGYYGPPQEEGWVVCRAFMKRTTGQTKSSTERWDSTYFYDEPSTGGSSVVDPIDHYVTRQTQSYLVQNLMCKQEIEADSLNFMHSDDQFVQLPQLESPSLPLIRRPSPSSVSLVSENNEEDEPTRGFNHNNSNNNNKKVTDWRALDKFVASQLSQEDRYENDHVGVLPSFGDVHNNSDMGSLLLLQSGREEAAASKFNGFLGSSSDCDIGICIFDK